VTRGYGYGVPSGTFPICIIAFLVFMRSKIISKKEGYERLEKRFIQIKKVDLALQSVAYR